MSEIKLSEIWVLGAEPLKGCTPESMRSILMRYPEDEVLAMVMAGVSNRIGWEDAQIEDSSDEMNKKFMEESDEWWVLKKQLYTEIIRRLEIEHLNRDVSYITKDIGLYNAIKPFMERNGYIDGRGWWIRKTTSNEIL